MNFSVLPCGGMIADGILDTQPVSREGEEGTRKAVSTFHLLLIKQSHTTFHKIDSDEVVFYHLGGPCYIHILNETTGELKSEILGNPLATPDAKFQVTMPRGVWFSQEPLSKDGFHLMGLSMSPALKGSDLRLPD